jgi:hypothetical protein
MSASSSESAGEVTSHGKFSAESDSKTLSGQSEGVPVTISTFLTSCVDPWATWHLTEATIGAFGGPRAGSAHLTGGYAPLAPKLARVTTVSTQENGSNQLLTYIFKVRYNCARMVRWATQAISSNDVIFWVRFLANGPQPPLRWGFYPLGYLYQVIVKPCEVA